MSRLSVRVRNSAVTLIVKKALNFNLINSGKYNEGELMNYIQVDCIKFEKSVIDLRFARVPKSFFKPYPVQHYRIGKMLLYLGTKVLPWFDQEPWQAWL